LLSACFMSPNYSVNLPNKLLVVLSNKIALTQSLYNAA